MPNIVFEDKHFAITEDELMGVHLKVRVKKRGFTLMLVDTADGLVVVCPDNTKKMVVHERNGSPSILIPS